MPSNIVDLEQELVKLQQQLAVAREVERHLQEVEEETRLANERQDAKVAQQEQAEAEWRCWEAKGKAKARSPVVTEVVETLQAPSGNEEMETMRVVPQPLKRKQAKGVPEVVADLQMHSK